MLGVWYYFSLFYFKFKMEKDALSVFHCFSGGNEYGQCGEEPERKDEHGRTSRRDIAIPQRCAPKLSVRQVRKKFHYLSKQEPSRIK